MFTNLDVIRNKRFLQESVISANIVTAKEYENLNEEQKEMISSEMFKSILQNIMDKAKSVDTTEIDRSRGDLKHYDMLQIIQNVIKTLQYYYSTADDSINYGQCSVELKKIVDSLQYLNKYSDIFKDAYRNKKTILMVTYQSVLLAILTALNYLVSESIDYSEAPNIKLKDRIQLNTINQFNAIAKFNDLCKNNDLAKLNESVNFIRTYYNEFSPREMNIIYEAADIGELINTGFDNIVKTLTGNDRLNSIIFKAASIITLLLAAREVFYSINAGKLDMSKVTNNLKQFVNMPELRPAQVQQVKNYNKQNIVNTVAGSQQASQALNIENNKIANDIARNDTTNNIQNKNLEIADFDMDTFNF